MDGWEDRAVRTWEAKLGALALMWGKRMAKHEPWMRRG